MLIFDEANRRKLDSILIMLTPSEKDELVSYLNGLNPDKGDHFHIYDQVYQEVITLAVYTPSNVHFFSPEIQTMLDPGVKKD